MDATGSAAQANGVAQPQLQRPSLSSDSASLERNASATSISISGGDSMARRGSSETNRLSSGLEPQGGRGRRLSGNMDTAKMRQSVKDMVAEEKAREAKVENRKLPFVIRVSRCIVDNTVFVTITTLLTLWALTADDFRLMLTNQPADTIFDVMTVLCLVTFSFEICLSCLGKQDYIFGFFFWLDLVSTVTLVLDITTVNDYLFQSSEEDLNQMKNSKTARIGARAARVVRVLRLVRILKLYKAIYEARQKAAREKARQENPDEWDDEDMEAPDEQTTESNVGKKLSDLTTRRCVILILAMIGVSPILSPETTGKEPYPAAWTLGADIVEERFEASIEDDSARWMYDYVLLNQIYFHNWYAKAQELRLYWLGISGVDEELCRSKAAMAKLNAAVVKQWEEDLVAPEAQLPFSGKKDGLPQSVQSILGLAWESECRSHTGTLRIGISLIGKLLDGIVDYAVDCPEKLRRVESQAVTAKLLSSSRWSSWHFVFVFDRRTLVKEEAFYSFLTTVFVCILLCTASMIFSHDANSLVLKPVEMMMLKVHMIRVNPLVAAKLTDEAFKAEEIQKARMVARMKKQKWRAHIVSFFDQLCKDSEKNRSTMETAILEKTIIKLGTLLALGFGTAGMNIISHNMQGQDTAGVDAMIPGQMVECIICYVRMANFSTITEVLQSRVMTFVNQVAEIIHGVVDSYHGAPSRNNGDTFLTVWTITDEAEKDLLTVFADMAVMATAVALAGVNRSSTLAAYRTHPGIQQRLGKHYRVGVSFGLHFGWAIEGALGTEYKIDATYVSPNVSIAESVERAADLYGTSVLLTEATHSMLSTGMQAKCRLIDQVKIRGSPLTMKLFTLDLNHMALDIEPSVDMRWNTRMRFRCRQFLEGEKTKRLCSSMAEAFEKHEDLVMMRTAYTVKFHEVFGMGYQNYSQGEWRAANRLLERALTLLDIPDYKDGPSLALLRFMQCYNNIAPEWWKGVHPLEDMPGTHRASFLATGSDALAPSAANQWRGGAVRSMPISSDLITITLQEIAEEEPANIGLKLRG